MFMMGLELLEASDLTINGEIEVILEMAECIIILEEGQIDIELETVEITVELEDEILIEVECH